MSADTPETNDDSYFQYGDWVEFKLNSNLFGIVVAIDTFGLIYTVQLAGSGRTQMFHGVTLRALDTPDGDEPLQDAAEGSNVIDFTRAVDLRAAKTKGTA